MHVLVRVRARLCLFVVSARIPSTLQVTKAATTSKVEFLAEEDPAGALSEGLKDCASAPVTCSSSSIVHILYVFGFRQRYQKKSVFTRIPAQHLCITCPPLAPVCFGIPSKVFYVYQRDRQAIKSQDRSR